MAAVKGYQLLDKKTAMKEFSIISQKQTFAYQAKFFLNAFWKEYSKEAENVFAFTAEFADLHKKGVKGANLDEFEAHRLLEKQGNVLTVIEMRTGKLYLHSLSIIYF